MKQFFVRPDIHAFKTCAEFAEEFNIGEGDLIFTNEYILHPCFDHYINGADVLFQEKYGVSPARYLKTIRMEHARRLIQEHMPIQHVAREAGYCDIYQFSRAYKQYYGHAPTNEGK